MKIEKRFLQKRKILINTARSTTLENCYLWKENWVGGLEHGPPSKKKASPPPALMINYITCLAVLLCLPYFLTCLLAGCCAVCVLYLSCCVTALLIALNNPFNTLISVYIRSIDIVLIINIITR